MTTQFREGAEAFADYCSVSKGLSTNTLIAYRNDIDEFLLWLPYYREEQYNNLASHYLSALTAKQLASGSIARKGTTLRSFFRFLTQEQYFARGVLPLKFHNPKQKRGLPHFLTPAEVDSLINVSTNKRDITIVNLLFSSGIRVSELTGLNLESVDLDRAEMRIKGKGDKERIAFMSKRSLALLKDYLNDFPRTAKSPVFLNYKNTRLDVRSVHRLLLDLGTKAKLDKPVHPHVFRHSFATHLLNNDVNLRVVQELLGHDSIKSTQIYTHVDIKRLKEVYLRTHPRALEGVNS